MGKDWKEAITLRKRPESGNCLASTSRIAPTVEGTVIEVESTTQHNYKSSWVSCVKRKETPGGLVR